MPGQWQISDSHTTVNVAGSASVTLGTTGNAVIRLRALQAMVGSAASGGGAASATLVVRDGATGAGTIIWAETLTTAISGNLTGFTSSDMDLRATSGTMTVEFTGSPGTNATSSVNAQGDFTVGGRQYGAE